MEVIQSRLTWVDVLPLSKAESIADDALTSHEVVPSTLDLLTLPPSPPEGPDAVGIPESNDSETSDHTSARVRARGRLHDFAHGTEDVVGVDTEFTSLLERVGEEVEEELRVGGRVDVTVSVVVEVVVQVGGVGEVSVL
jgi:hypothetical protein